MNDAPSVMADHPARRAPAASFRPNCCPTRTAAAELIPSGTMNVSAAQFKAISWPESGTAPSFAISAVAALNAPISQRIWVAAGAPSLSSAHMRCRSIRIVPAGLVKALLRFHSTHNSVTASTPAMYTRAKHVDHPDPVMPMARKPRCP